MEIPLPATAASPRCWLEVPRDGSLLLGNLPSLSFLDETVSYQGIPCQPFYSLPVLLYQQRLCYTFQAVCFRAFCCSGVFWFAGESEWEETSLSRLGENSYMDNTDLNLRRPSLYSGLVERGTRFVFRRLVSKASLSLQRRSLSSQTLL